MVVVVDIVVDGEVWGLRRFSFEGLFRKLGGPKLSYILYKQSLDARSSAQRSCHRSAHCTIR